MAKVSTTIRTDKDVKQEAQRIFSDLGMDMSTAVNVFFHQVIISNGLPFSVKMDRPNAVTSAAMEDAVNGKDVYGPYDSVKSLMDALNA